MFVQQPEKYQPRLRGTRKGCDSKKKSRGHSGGPACGRAPCAEVDLGHGDLALAQAEDLQKRIAALPVEADCDALRQVVDTLGDQTMETHNAAQRAYDDETSHGRTQGAVFP